ncbi:hypothetical protein EZS27_000338 [termite gut metagenome]|uniref:HTH cro/C1-type domain-containing protein n=1 Tax=termite gut metagenome TaxID=433724 RepID=A0A5J4T2Q3_9ZZZZ
MTLFLFYLCITWKFMKIAFTEITTKEQFAEARNALEAITAKMTKLGKFDFLSKEEQDTYDCISDMIYEWETIHHPLPGRTSKAITQTVQIRMNEMNLKQKDVAGLLGISESRMSDFLKGKRNITLRIAKNLRDKMNIPADFILDNI